VFEYAVESFVASVVASVAASVVTSAVIASSARHGGVNGVLGRRKPLASISLRREMESDNGETRLRVRRRSVVDKGFICFILYVSPKLWLFI